MTSNIIATGLGRSGLIVCQDCIKDIFGVDTNAVQMKYRPYHIYDVNIGFYFQDCHLCIRQIHAGSAYIADRDKTIRCVLFERPPLEQVLKAHTREIADPSNSQSVFTFGDTFLERFLFDKNDNYFSPDAAEADEDIAFYLDPNMFMYGNNTECFEACYGKPASKGQDIESMQWISADLQYAKFGANVFELGETVRHQDEDSGEAVILMFSIDAKNSDVVVQTDKGLAKLPFLEKL